MSNINNMADWHRYPLRVPSEMWRWFINHSNEMGENIATIFRRALREYRSRHTRQ